MKCFTYIILNFETIFVLLQIYFFSLGTVVNFIYVIWGYYFKNLCSNKKRKTDGVL